MGCTAVPRRLSRARAEPFRLCVVRPGWQTVNVDFFSNKKNSTSLPAFSARVFLSKTCLGAICDDRGAHCHEIVHASGAGGAAAAWCFCRVRTACSQLPGAIAFLTGRFQYIPLSRVQ